VRAPDPELVPVAALDEQGRMVFEATTTAPWCRTCGGSLAPYPVALGLHANAHGFETFSCYTAEETAAMGYEPANPTGR
jgi:hypothetical protein